MSLALNKKPAETKSRNPNTFYNKGRDDYYKNRVYFKGGYRALREPEEKKKTEKNNIEEEVAAEEKKLVVEDNIDVDVDVEEVVVAEERKIVKEDDTVDFEKVAGVVGAAEEKKISEENSIAVVVEEEVQEATEEKKISEEDNIDVDVEEEVQVAPAQKRRTVYPPCNCKAIKCFSKIPEHDRLIINRSYSEKTNTQRKQWVYDHITRSAQSRCTLRLVLVKGNIHMYIHYQCHRNMRERR